MVLPEHEQSTLREVGLEGCYLLTVKKIAEIETGRVFNPVDMYWFTLGKNWIKSNCLLNDAAAILSHYTGSSWRKVPAKIGANLPVGDKRYLVAEYVKKSGSSTATHFVLLHEDLSMWYNPMNMDMTGWTLNSLRVFIEDLGIAQGGVGTPGGVG